jgi:Cu/Ag efflux pump CusA
MTKQEREQKIESSSKLVAKAVVSAILITLVSFSPILFLEGQEKKMFSPLVWTKTFAMIGSMFVAVIVVPVLMVYLLKGKVKPANILYHGSSSSCTHPLFAGAFIGRKPPLQSHSAWYC